MNMMYRFNKFLRPLKNLYLASRFGSQKLEKPLVIQLPVNDICDSHCQMCNIWQKKIEHQITPAELAQVLQSTLFSKVRSVGVNGGEPTLRTDLAELVEVLYTHLPKLQTISLITNGLNSQRVIARIREVSNVVQTYGGRLDVMVSLDGVGAIHDEVRGREGAFENAVQVIDFILASTLIHKCRLGCTVIRANVYGLHDLLEFAINKGIYIKYRLGIPHQRLYSDSVVDPFALTFPEKYHFVIFLENLIHYYETSVLQQTFYQSLIGQMMYGRPRVAGCEWQHRGVTLLPRGELLYCAVESKVLGSALSEEPAELYFNNESHLREIINTKCATCMHDYTGLPPLNVMARHYITKLQAKVAPASRSSALAKNMFEMVRGIKHRLSFHKRIQSLDVDGGTSIALQPTKQFPRCDSAQRKVLICGWYGTETLGDKAILAGVVAALQQALGNFDLHLASLETYISQMTLLQMPELQAYTLHTIPEAIALADSVDLVVFGGGPIMAIDPVLDMLAIFQHAAQAQVPTLVAGCGVGPLGEKRYNRVIRQLLGLASGRIYRDYKSKKLAQSLGIRVVDDQVAEDPAFTWLAANTSTANQVHRGPPRLLLGLREWPYKQYAPKWDGAQAEQVKMRFEQEVVAAFQLVLTEFPDLKIVPFPMCTNHIGGDDRWFYRNLFRDQPIIAQALDMTYLGPEVAPQASIAAFRQASVALTMRFHSLVFALALGVPAVSIDYTLGRGKVKALAEKYKVPQMSLDTITREFMAAKITDALLSQPAREGHFTHDVLFTQTVAAFIKTLQ